MIDLHTHTTASDGADEPAVLAARAAAAGVRVLAITDHDTLAGADAVCADGNSTGMTFVRGIELSTRLEEEPSPESRSVHILGYFFGEPSQGFRDWLDTLKAWRRARNEAMAAKLRALGVAVTVEEAESLGRNVTGRPHFAHLLQRKGFVRSYEEAFLRYLGEKAPAFVEREDPAPEEGIARIRAAGGIASLAHPVRLLKPPAEEEALVRRFADASLDAIEAWHTDHNAAAVERYLGYASKYSLAVTVGSDYHGPHKPKVCLGFAGNGGTSAPSGLLDDLRRRALHG